MYRKLGYTDRSEPDSALGGKWHEIWCTLNIDYDEVEKKNHNETEGFLIRIFMIISKKAICCIKIL